MAGLVSYSSNSIGYDNFPIEPVEMKLITIVEHKKPMYLRLSYYSFPHHGRPTASGEIYNAFGLTAAHRSLAFGTRLRVTNPVSGVSVVVRVNDRGPFYPGRDLDLSYKAAWVLGVAKAGVTQLRVEVL